MAVGAGALAATAGAWLVLGGCEAVLGLGDLQARGGDSGSDVSTADGTGGGGDGTTGGDGATGADGPSTDGGMTDTGTTDAAGLYLSPQRVAVDSSYVYWTDQGTFTQGAPDGDGKVMRAPLDGGAPEAIATNQLAPYGLVVTEAAVYWTDFAFGGSDIMMAPLTGGVPGPPSTVVADGSGNNMGLFVPMLLAVEQGIVYWTDRSLEAVVAQPVAGGAATVIQYGTMPSDIAADSSYVYWTDLGLWAAPLGGGSPFQIAAASSSGPITLDSTNVYYGDQGTIFAIAIADIGTDAGPTPVATGLNNAGAIAVDPARGAYWTDENPSGLVAWAPFDGGGPQTLASQQLSPFGLALTPSAVYWADQGIFPNADGGLTPGSVQSHSR